LYMGRLQCQVLGFRDEFLGIVVMQYRTFITCQKAVLLCSALHPPPSPQCLTVEMVLLLTLFCLPLFSSRPIPHPFFKPNIPDHFFFTPFSPTRLGKPKFQTMLVLKTRVPPSLPLPWPQDDAFCGLEAMLPQSIPVQCSTNGNGFILRPTSPP
jgi:hypothetical protein